MLNALTRSFTSVIKTTPINAYHKSIGGKMVPFAGYDMPVEYREFSGGVLKEHMHTREKAGLFDVSHMGQVKLFGKDREAFLNGLVVADVPDIPIGNAVLSLLMNENGGIIDDTIITRFDDHIGIVLNAGCKDKDLAHIHEHLKNYSNSGKDVALEYLAGQGLLALQGPQAAAQLQSLVPHVDLSALKFMSAVHTNFPPLDCPITITRCGYTGEDGFEISISEEKSTPLFDFLINSSQREILPIGLGARDSLRLEAGLCLYGHELEEDISPVEASLLWTIGKKKKKEGGYLGDKIVLEQQANGVSRKRVGFTIEKGPSAREHTQLEKDGDVVGEVSSGVFSPCLKKAIGMAYVKKSASKIGTEFKIVGKKFIAKVVKMPWVEAKYFK